MASKVPFIRDGAITEQQLAPHLRRKKVGVASIINSSSSSSSSTSGTIVGLYSGGVQSSTADIYDSADLLLAVDTTHINLADVTSTNPFSLVANRVYDIEVNLDVAGEYTNLIVMCQGNDFANHAIRTGTHIYMYARLLPAGQPITIALRCLGFGGNAQINSSTIALRAV